MKRKTCLCVKCVKRQRKSVCLCLRERERERERELQDVMGEMRKG